MEYCINSPINITVPNAIHFLNELNEAIENINIERIIISFKGLKWTEPFACLMLARGVKLLNSKEKDIIFTIAEVPNNHYAAHIGFFRAMGSEKFGPDLGSSNASDTCIPISPINLDEIRKTAKDEYLFCGEVVQEKSDSLASILLKGDNEHKYHEPFSYMFREILRNSAEHSESNQVFVCAQYWPNFKMKGPTVEIGIIDEGIGLCKSLRKVERLKPYIDNAEKAIGMATAPGVSRMMDTKFRIPSEWHNSGYGLYVTRELGQLAGSTTVITNGHGIIFGEGRSTTLEKFLFRGTGVKIRLEFNRVHDWETTLKIIREKSLDDSKQWENVLDGYKEPSVKSFS